MTSFGDLNLKIPIDVGYFYIFFGDHEYRFSWGTTQTKCNSFSQDVFSKSEVKFIKQTSICNF